MKKNNSILKIVLICALGVSGCFETNTITPELNTTQFFVTPSHTSSPQEAEILIKNYCLDTNNSSLTETLPSGYLVTEKEIINLQSKESRLLSLNNKEIKNIVISPNKKYVSYQIGKINNFQQFIPELLIIANSKEVTFSLPWNSDWWEANWINNEQIVISQSNEQKNTFLFLNVITEKIEKEIHLDYSNMFSKIVFLQENQSPIQIIPAFFNSNLSHVIYYRDPNEGVFFNLLEERELAIFSTPLYGTQYGIDDTSLPVWSPTLDSFVIENADTIDKRDLYQIFLDGRVFPLTNFINYSNLSRLQNYRWSPDGIYIAFWLSTESIKNELMVLDVPNKEILRLCISASSSNNEVFINTQPVWINNHQLLIETFNDINSIVLIDIDRKTAIQVAEGVQLMGWMESP